MTRLGSEKSESEEGEEERNACVLKSLLCTFYMST